MRLGRMWYAAVGAASAILYSAEAFAANRVEAGLLTCEVSGGVALIISSPRALHCVFQKSNGLSEAYGGRIKEFGLDIGVTGAGVIVWSVAAETTDVPPGLLAGTYVGAEAGGSVVVGGTGRALVGGSRQSVALQPLSVEGHVGLNIAVGVASIELHPLFRAPAEPARVSMPAVGHAYAEVPHARQAPHYGCGSYTHLMRGQTLYGLAHACGVTVEALLDANPQITNVRDVATGALVHLPHHVGHHVASPCGNRAVLQDRESLDHLAWRCGVTLHALLRANPSVRDMAMVQPGLVLTVPGRRPAPTSPPVRFAKNESASVSDLRPSNENSGPVDERSRPDSSNRIAQSRGNRAQDNGIRTERVRFKPGETGTSITGKIVGYDGASYVIGAEAGETMKIRLKPSNLATYFNVYEPGKGPGDQALATGSMTGPMTPDLNRFEGNLPTSGEYTISVYMMRSAARRNETSNYTLDISVSALDDVSKRGPVQKDFADGLQGGPDYWDVRTASQSGNARIHARPSAAARVVGSVPNGAVLRNLGCRMAEARRWCRVETVDLRRLSGWTTGNLLRESSYSGAQAPGRRAVASGTPVPSHDALVPGTKFNATGNIPCARASGQPIGSCKFGVVRRGQGNGSVTVFWPDGGNRVIFFENGTPASFDKAQADGNARMTVKRNSDLFNVTIGTQRFEIPEAVIVGG